MSFRVTCWLFITLLPPCFLLFTFPLQVFVYWNGYLICNRAQFLCNFQFLMWLLILMPCPLIGPFIFRGLVYHCWLVDPGQVLCVGLILPCRSFRLLPWCCLECLSTYLVRRLPCIWITVLQKHICLIKMVQCLLFFPDWPAGYWVWLTSMVLLLFQQSGGWLSVPGPDASRVASSPSGGSSSFSALGSTRGRSAGILYHSHHVGGCSLAVSHHQDLVVDVSVGHVLKGLPYLHITLRLLRGVCYTDKGSFPLEHLHQRSTSSVGRNGQVGVLGRVYPTMPYLSQINWFFCSFIKGWPGLAWPGIQLVYIVLLYLLF